MSGRLLISSLPGELRAARLDDDGSLQDYLVQRHGSGSGQGDMAVGDVWVARVLRLQKNLGAFIAIGGSKPALLDWADCRSGLSEGAAVTVQVTRLAQAGKGAKVKAVDPPAPPQDAHALPLRLIRGDEPLSLLGATVEEVLCDDGDLLATLRRLLPADVTARLQGPRPPLFDTRLEEEIDRLLAREVPLPGGGRLLIEPVETLTAIDVDSGGKAAGPETNLAAAKEIARQVRLRALSGLIVVDFLAMGGRGQRDRLHATLKTAFADDPVETSIFPPLPSGLVEIARQRRRPALHEVVCRYAAWQPSAETQGYAALRQALAHPPAAALTLTLPPAVAAALEGPLAEARQAVEAKLGAPLRLCMAEPEAPQPSGTFPGEMLE